MDAMKVAAETRSIPRNPRSASTSGPGDQLVTHRRNLVDQGVSSLLCSPHRLQVVMEDYAVSLLVEGLTCQPATMALCPVLPGRVAAGRFLQC